ncbi:MAG: hypothetical protein IK095_07540 [Oscillospiraceae bacterium]|nr:hypothetical protein [Oscillospiraceae bacterium]
MEIFEEKVTVSPSGLCAGDLFRLIQKVSGDHCRQIGYGETVMAELGVMWVIVRHGVEVLRWPEPGEALLVRTWPGPTRHGMCPRWYRIESGYGQLLIAGCAIWSVVDRQTRKMAIPAERGVTIEPLTTGLESRRPAAPGKLPETERAATTVSAAVLDENGHMNNTRYYDLAERLLGTTGRPLRSAVTEYVSEAREGDLLQLSWGREGGRCCLSGRVDSPAFRMELVYAD